MERHTYLRRPSWQAQAAFLQLNQVHFALKAELRLRHRGNGRVFRKGSEAPCFIGEEGFSGGKNAIQSAVWYIMYYALFLTTSVCAPPYSQHIVPLSTLKTDDVGRSRSSRLIHKLDASVLCVSWTNTEWCVHQEMICYIKKMWCLKQTVSYNVPARPNPLACRVKNKVPWFLDSCTCTLHVLYKCKGVNSSGIFKLFYWDTLACDINVWCLLTT